MSIHYPENQFRPSLNVSGLNDIGTPGTWISGPNN